MTRMRLAPVATVIAAALSASLTGCVSFTEEPPPSLLTVTPSVTAPAGQRTGSVEEALAITIPTTPPALQNLRVMVQASDTSIAYIKEARWSATPDRLFWRLLGSVVEGRTGRIVLDPLQLAASPKLRLTGHLERFGLDARTMEAVVVYEAAMLRDRATIDSRRFEARVPVTLAEGGPVGVGLNQAANQVASEVADWIGAASLGQTPAQ